MVTRAKVEFSAGRLSAGGKAVEWRERASGQVKKKQLFEFVVTKAAREAGL